MTTLIKHPLLERFIENTEIEWANYSIMYIKINVLHANN